MSNVERLKNVEELIDIDKIDIGKIVIENCKKDFWYFVNLMGMGMAKYSHDVRKLYDELLKEPETDQRPNPEIIPMDDFNRNLLACFLIYEILFKDGYQTVYYVGKDKESAEKFLNTVFDFIQQNKFDAFMKRKSNEIYYDYNGSFIKVLPTPQNLTSAKNLFCGVSADIVIIDDMALNEYFKEICNGSATTGRATKRIIAVPSSGELNIMIKTMGSLIKLMNELYPTK